MEKRTIETVLDIETGEEIIAEIFFQRSEQEIFEYRRKLQDAISGFSNPKFICYYCKQKVKINGGIQRIDSDHAQIYHFAHLKDSDECPIKTNTRFSKEEIECIKYNGAKESALHIQTKELIGTFLRLNEQNNNGVSDVVIDQVFKTEPISKFWRKPDVRCTYKEKTVVFEIQLSTTFLSVIADREHFYNSNGVFIIWVFKSFHLQSELQRFAQKDIFYGNNCNVYVLDAEAIGLSEKAGDLILHCFYVQYEQSEDKAIFSWKDQFVALNDLTFVQKSAKVHYYDTIAGKKNIEDRIETERLAKVEQDRKQKEWQDESDARNAQYANQENILYSGLQATYENPSELVKLFLRISHTRLHYTASLLRKGYQPTPMDLRFFNAEFENGLQATKNLPYKHLTENIASFIFMHKSRNPDLSYSIQMVLFAILSLKKDMIIGSNYKSHLSIAHKIIESRKQFFFIYLKAMHYYKRYDGIMKEDKSKKLQTKISQLDESQNTQDEKSLSSVKLIFPELFNN